MASPRLEPDCWERQHEAEEHLVTMQRKEVGRRLFLREATVRSVACAAARGPTLSVSDCKEGEGRAENWEGLDMRLQSVVPAGPSRCHLGGSFKDQCAESIFCSQICLFLGVAFQTNPIILLHRPLGGLWTHHPCVTKGSGQETIWGSLHIL